MIMMKGMIMVMMMMMNAHEKIDQDDPFHDADEALYSEVKDHDNVNNDNDDDHDGNDDTIIKMRTMTTHPASPSLYWL